MFDQIAFGERLKNIRKEKGLTQEEAAGRIGVSGQAVSKWEKGECLPDVYNLKLLGRLYRVSVDSLLETEGDGDEKVVETIKIGEAVFELVEKPMAILAGRIIYAKDYADLNEFHAACESISAVPLESIEQCRPPVNDICLSINFWRDERTRAMGFVRETLSEIQPEGVNTYINPASLYIKAYTDKHTARLISKEQCDIWELFAYIRQFFMPAHGFKMNNNGAQELEVYDTAEHKAGYVYMPVNRK